MLLKLRSQIVAGVSVIDQILDYFQTMIVEAGWPEDIRSTKDIITEIRIVVSSDQFANTLDNYYAFLYVGTHESLPRTFASFFRHQPFRDWIILLKPKENHYADPVYIFSTVPTIH